MSVVVRAERAPVGEFLSDELLERGWTQTEFAEILGRPIQFVSEIISGRKEITRESAAQIAAAFGDTAQYWLNLQDDYLLWRQEKDTSARERLDDVRLRARLRELAPVSALVRRGALSAGPLHKQAEEIKRLYGMRSLEEQPGQQLAAKRANVDEELTSAQLAWTALARRQAEVQATSEYSAAALRRLARKLPSITRDPEQFERLPELFAGCGVALVYVEALPGSKIDGCSFIVQATGRPAIALSGRGKRLDKVLFALLHEVAHILLGHLDGDGLIVDEQDEASYTLGGESEANDLAAEWILPKALPSPPERIRVGWVNQVAAAHTVHPIVVVGQLQNRHILDWRTALVRGAPNVDAHLRAWNDLPTKLES
ncbi:HigA family addiction module antidote protein [Curtobacterium albidum]|uniref:HigA family addiction module antidote protein n=1 Tax=Curtobacterium citreum TaxID=2036 RepID=A0A850DXC3_9MICO|nr:HigA family addiction module antidote protein [Curtobacterium albidum]